MVTPDDQILSIRRSIDEENTTAQTHRHEGYLSMPIDARCQYILPLPTVLQTALRPLNDPLLLHTQLNRGQRYTNHLFVKWSPQPMTGSKHLCRPIENVNLCLGWCANILCTTSLGIRSPAEPLVRPAQTVPLSTLENKDQPCGTLAITVG